MAAPGRSSSSEPTEAPTATRLAEARRRGEVALSADAVTAAALAAAGLALVGLAPQALTGLVAMVRAGLSAAVVPATDGGFAPGAALSAALAVAAKVVLPVAAVGAMAALAIGLLQTRGVLRAQALGVGAREAGGAPRRGRLLAVAADTLKVAVVVAVAWATWRQMLPPLVRLTAAPAAQVATVGGALAVRLAGRLVGVVAILALIDYLLIWRAHGRRLRMTREEVRHQRRQTEGDERVRGWRRQQHRVLVTGAGESEVAAADFVVIGAGPIALAVRYHPGGPRAPVVVASGVAERAQEILRQAAAAGVRMVEDAELARALESTPEGAEIAAAQYDAVAALLRVDQTASSSVPDAPAAP